MTGPDDTTPPSEADDTLPAPRCVCGHHWCPACYAAQRATLAIDDCLDDDEPERTWPIIGSAT